jgi:glycosyltransferase involved in cell wall biosynthesis
MKLAIVHDAIVNRGGAERVLGAFHEIFPEAPIYTTAYWPEHTHTSLQTAQIHTSLLQRVAKTETQLKMLFPLAFRLMQRLDLSEFDVVLSSSTYCAKNVDTPSSAVHVCYCYSPFRPVWEFDEYTEHLPWNALTRALMRKAFAQFRRTDFKAAQKPDYIVAISQHAARKIERAYGRKPDAVIYPFVDVNAYRWEPSQGYFLVVSRLAAYKRVDIAIEAFNQLKLPLKVVGTGPDLRRLQEMAGPNIQFLGAASEEDLRDYYARCRCLVFPGQEDFGLVPLEAHASGKPVIAFAAGGALETVIGAGCAEADKSDATGLFFGRQTPDAMVNAVKQFEKLAFDPERIRERALQFDKAHFMKRIRSFIRQVYDRSLIPEMWTSASDALYLESPVKWRQLPTAEHHPETISLQRSVAILGKHHMRYDL